MIVHCQFRRRASTGSERDFARSGPEIDCCAKKAAISQMDPQAVTPHLVKT
jgi:hypothetical protein